MPSKIWDIWKEEKVDKPSGRPKFKEGDILFFPAAKRGNIQKVMRITTDKMSSEWYYMMKGEDMNKEIPISERSLFDSKARKMKAMDNHVRLSVSKRQKQQWMARFDKAVIKGKPKIHMNLPQDYWDTAAHFFFQGMNPEDAAARYLSRRRSSYTIASQLVKLAKVLVSEKTFELRHMTMDDVMNDTPLTRLKIIHKGTMDEINAFAKKKGLEWKDSRRQIFGGYWYDKKNGEAYMIT